MWINWVAYTSQKMHCRWYSQACPAATPATSNCHIQPTLQMTVWTPGFWSTAKSQGRFCAWVSAMVIMFFSGILLQLWLFNVHWSLSIVTKLVTKTQAHSFCSDSSIDSNFLCPCQQVLHHPPIVRNWKNTFAHNKTGTHFLCSHWFIDGSFLSFLYSGGEW